MNNVLFRKGIVFVVLAIFIGMSYVSGSGNYSENTLNFDNSNNEQYIFQTSLIDDIDYEYPVMKLDSVPISRWLESYNDSPKIKINNQLLKTNLVGTNFDLLSHLDYIPNEHFQGSCSNCWAWVGTGILGIALDVQENIKDRLSVQYINSCQFDEIGIPPCSGGYFSDFADFYNSTKMAIPWSNTNAYWQDYDGQSSTACGEISTEPYYLIDFIQDEVIDTWDIGQNNAINIIKSVLNQNTAISFSFFLPNFLSWQNFTDFWFNNSENTIYDIDKYNGIPYNSNSGNGHSVICVGYNDIDPNNSYWVMLNSWGDNIYRPNGLFRIDMNMDYNCTYPENGEKYNAFYWQTLNVSFNIPVVGDMDGSGYLNSADVRYLSCHIVGKAGYETLQADGDVDCSGFINSADVRYLACHIVGKAGYEDLYWNC